MWITIQYCNSINILLTGGKRLHDRIISPRWEVLAHKTSSTNSDAFY